MPRICLSAVGVVDTIEAHVSVAHDQVEEGREQLIKASTYQASSTLLPPDVSTLSCGLCEVFVDCVCHSRNSVKYLTGFAVRRKQSGFDYVLSQATQSALFVYF